MNFTISKRASTITLALIVIGLVMAIIGVMGDHTDHKQYSWAAFYTNALFFFFIALGTLFFYTLNHVTESAWTVLVKRVYEAVTTYLPWGALAVLVVLVAGSMGLHHIFPWMDSRVLDISDPNNYDGHIAGIASYLNKPFFWFRALLILGVFVFYTRWFRKHSIQMDGETGEVLMRSHWKNYNRSVLFIVFFAFFSSILAWDWVMSIDPHWHSALFGWYVFGGMWASAMITAVILVLYLKGKGYLPQVNANHLQDMGKWMFAVSFLWSYLYFEQFLLIWYSNVPEESAYYFGRLNNHPWLTWVTFFVNFALPMVLLMSRDSKRSPKFLIGVGVLIFIGHWLDTVQMIMPSSLALHFERIGILEVGFFMAFLGLFIRMVLTALSKAPLTVVAHPFLEESVHHHI
ncbi:MAG TPA: quinol:cytochrome C oxidoreductase [Flavobacteriales bacterium]|nr:quinol:cytochrome C oxidoreductase [Flavobacteriales bacterium]